LPSFITTHAFPSAKKIHILQLRWPPCNTSVAVWPRSQLAVSFALKLKNINFNQTSNFSHLGLSRRETCRITEAIRIKDFGKGAKKTTVFYHIIIAID